MHSNPHEESKLDNPVLYALQESHQSFGATHEGMYFYLPKYCPFGASTPTTMEGIRSYAKATEQFYLVGDKPLYGPQVLLEKGLPCVQMVLSSPVDLPITETIYPLTTPQQKKDLYALVQTIQPGYFQSKTTALGSYYGIYREGLLVAACGERMKMNAFSEISAIVTQPNYRGMGLASQLIKHTTDTVFHENKRPFLHVIESNKVAIRLYESLGFIPRRLLYFWKFRRA